MCTGYAPISRASHWLSRPVISSTADVYPFTFDRIRDYEQRLPQHNTSLQSPEGVNGRTLTFSNEVWGLGLNNQLNNRLVLSHLAYLSNRSYVFHDIMFGDEWEDGIWYPLNTFISGPTAGGPFPLSAASSPRAISVDYWRQICPKERRNVLEVDAINKELDSLGQVDGALLLERWAEKLRAIPDTCVEISYMSEHIIDFHFFGSRKSLSLLLSLLDSPMISHFRWSDVVLHAVAHNIPLIAHNHSAYVTLSTHVSSLASNGFATDVSQTAVSSARITQELSNVLAIHIRRGDYLSHCKHMASYGSGYNSWNLLPSLPDAYNPPIETKEGNDLDEFMRHCWPSVDDVVQRVREVKRDYEEQGRENLRAIYVLTNGKQPWIGDLKESLLTSGMGWEHVTSSRDLKLNSEPEKLASQAVDMEIARRAALFVGNGFSTMTANILMLRLANGAPAQTTRFW
ncbi:hypothetical protein K439DRAFT_1329053 [Ramaria rubella]|nr:hypothetical protein K439DRAFT_1329053 [Ramaria rubella]